MRAHLVRTTAAVVLVALTLLTFGFWWVLHVRLKHDVNVVLRERERAAAALIVFDHGRLAVEETAGDEAIETGFWLYDLSGRVVAAPATSGAVRVAAVALSQAGGGQRDTSGTRLLAAPARVAGNRVGTIVVGVPLSTFRGTERVAVSAAVALDLIVLVGTLWLTRRNVTNALAPVAVMTAAAREWSAHDLDRRFDLGPGTDELTGLAATLDSMLGRLSSLIRHEQRLTAEIAHELKTPLARMRSTAEIAARHGSEGDRLDALVEVEQESDRLAGIIGTLLSAHLIGSTSSGVCQADALVSDEMHGLAADSPQLRFAVVAPDAPLLAGCDEDLLRRALAPVVANAVRYATTAVTATVAHRQHAVVVTIADDGPGFKTSDLERVFEPGFRGADVSAAGSGLGLPLARRLARVAGGDVVVRPGPGGHVELSFPAA